MPEMSDDLTSWNYDKNMTVPFLTLIPPQEFTRPSRPPALPPSLPR